VISYRHFCNKIWQAARFALLHLPTGGLGSLMTAAPVATNSSAAIHSMVPHQWILFRLALTINTVHDELSNYRLGRASAALYDFFLHDLCDTYIEFAKHSLASPVGLLVSSTRRCACVVWW